MIFKMGIHRINGYINIYKSLLLFYYNIYKREYNIILVIDIWIQKQEQCLYFQ
jgi:hypothetical protein